MKKLDKYEIIEEIGDGGFGVVYKALDPILQREVAIKIMKGELKTITEVVKRFTREARTLSQMQDPNIVTVYELGEYRDRPYIVMEFLAGLDLKGIIEKRVPLPLDEKVDIIRQVAQGLHNAHEKGIIHRDVKPGNIRILDNGVAKIMDFGIARLPASKMTTAGSLLGTLSYMSPEQINKIQNIDRRSDLFSLGVVFYEFLSYRKPFIGEGYKVMHDILHKQPEPLLEIKEQKFIYLANLITRLLQKDPEKRFKTARKVVDIINAHQAGVAGSKNRIEDTMDLAQTADIMAGDVGSHDVTPTSNLANTPAGQRKIKVLLQQANQSMEKKKYADVIDFAELIIAIDQNHDEVRELITQANEHIRQVNYLYEEAKAELDRDDLVKAKNFLEEARSIDPFHEEIKTTFEDVEERIELRRKVDGLIKEAKDEIESDRLGSALNLFDEALRLNPSHEVAKKLALEVKDQLAVKRQVDDLIELARRDVEGRRHSKALTHLEKARTIMADEPRVLSLIQDIERDMENQREAKELVQKAEQEISLGRAEDARPLLDKALKLDRHNPNVKDQLLAINKEAQRKEQITDFIHTARSEAESGKFTEALSMLEKARHLDPENHAIDQASAEIKTGIDHQLQGRVLLRNARQEHGEGRYRNALDILEEARKLDPHSEEIKHLNQEINKTLDRQREFQHLVKEAKSQFQSGADTSALELLYKAQEIETDDDVVAILIEKAETRIETKRKTRILRAFVALTAAISILASALMVAIYLKRGPWGAKAFQDLESTRKRIDVSLSDDPALHSLNGAHIQLPQSPDFTPLFTLGQSYEDVIADYEQAAVKMDDVRWDCRHFLTPYRTYISKRIIFANDARNRFSEWLNLKTREADGILAEAENTRKKNTLDDLFAAKLQLNAFLEGVRLNDYPDLRPVHQKVIQKRDAYEKEYEPRNNAFLDAATVCESYAYQTGFSRIYSLEEALKKLHDLQKPLDTLAGLKDFYPQDAKIEDVRDACIQNLEKAVSQIILKARAQEMKRPTDVIDCYKKLENYHGMLLTESHKETIRASRVTLIEQMKELAESNIAAKKCDAASSVVQDLKSIQGEDATLPDWINQRAEEIIHCRLGAKLAGIINQAKRLINSGALDGEEGAEKQLREADKMAPDSSEVRRLRSALRGRKERSRQLTHQAKTAFNNNRLGDAMGFATQAIRQWRGNSEANSLMLEINKQSGFFDEILNKATQALESCDFESAKDFLAQCGTYRQALDLKQRVENKQNRQDNNLDEVELALTKGDIAVAETTIQPVLSLCPSYQPALELKTRIANQEAQAAQIAGQAKDSLNQGSLQESKRFAAQALQLDTSNKIAQNVLGSLKKYEEVMCAAKRNIVEAAGILEQNQSGFSQLKPSSIIARIYLNASRRLALAGRCNEALPFAGRALEYCDQETYSKQDPSKLLRDLARKWESVLKNNVSKCDSYMVQTGFEKAVKPEEIEPYCPSP